MDNTNHSKLSSVEMMATYNAEWYGDQENGSYRSAKATLDSIADLIPNLGNNIQSVIDVGCGVGTWLKAWQEKYRHINICGIDGNNVESERFFIPHKYFRRVDLTANSNMVIREVLEHCKNTNIAIHTQSNIMGGGGQTL